MTEEKKRLKRSLIWFGSILAVGVAYLILNRVTGLGIPCPLYATTGLLCPGCGISRMCVAISRLDIARALGCNALVFCLLPAAAVFAVIRWLRYIKTGKCPPIPRTLHWGLLAVTLIFWILRNLEPFSFLAP